MPIRQINAGDGPEAVGAYAQALEVMGTTRRLYVSGQAPIAADGILPDTFEEQAKTVWTNILAQLHAADMSAMNIVKATTFLVDRKHRDANRDVRMAMLGGHTFALTVVLAGMFEDGWLLEIDAIAEK
ncbi:RidA family protein [Ruegeria sp. 2205SS24-7]|uniref:RidA family protein n=1 Tax=Ruegeria discodermiae TaxID=3064389 RepID=UPI002741EE9A|nr:RidA family protein [Ruegeria sp. 2205SS24-7]MDP5219794.1 RidA family protein [Ruegeria sp. 2205SS24-7]